MYADIDVCSHIMYIFYMYMYMYVDTHCDMFERMYLDVELFLLSI